MDGTHEDSADTGGLAVADWFAVARPAWFGTAAADLTHARAAQAADGFPDTCSIESWLTVRNTRGNVVNKRERVIAAGVPCRLTPVDLLVAGTSSGGAYGRSGELIDTTADQWQLSVPVGTDLRASYHVVMASGGRYEVTDVREEGSFRVETVARLVRIGLDQPGAGEGN